MHQVAREIAPTEVLPLGFHEEVNRPQGVEPQLVPAISSKTLSGRYQIGDIIGRGAFGVVHEGYDPETSRPVAIKFCDRQDRDAQARFRREASIGRSLDHERITRVYDFGSEGSTLFMVQEYLTGEDLEDLIRQRRPRSFVGKLDLLEQIARGMEHAHSTGVLHRDLKPANIRVLADGGIKILDFGSARYLDDNDRLTEIGTILGTLAYLAPEVLEGQTPRAASDIYGFGVLAYELLSFRRPFDAPSFYGLIHQIQLNSPPPLTQLIPDFPAALVELVDRCLRKDPEDRPSSFGEVVLELARLRADQAVAGESA